MQKSRGILFTALLTLSVASYAQTNTSDPQANTFSPVQTQAIEKIVHDYLISHPQVLMDAADALQKQQEQQWQNTANKTVPKIATQLFADPESPTIGNPNGNVTMVEFFDYQCPHCKEMGPEIDAIISADKNVRVVLKTLPIFGSNSEFAAKAVLASQKQGKFDAFHNALLADTKDRLTSDTVLKIASSVGINTKQLESDMKNPAINQELKNNYALAKQLDLTGTPGFVFGMVKIDPKTNKITDLKNPLLIPGAVDQSTLEEAIAETRGS